MGWRTKKDSSTDSTPAPTGFSPAQQQRQADLQARVVSNWRQPATAKKTAKREGQ
ncbi:hypothetical protein M8Z33_07365 [Streptomyces sp. ZAF1911]|uniref:hypothetical protein n=1 Tax=unclassified Streptomyces TaxID=2593676 RepID=UPI00237B3D77|nr:hypothetical protein [Streptomyces sp. ZAF1911]MDD9376492.1 hypothetical protein [Streptomyces sp. ZAF1911]